MGKWAQETQGTAFGPLKLGIDRNNTKSKQQNRKAKRAIIVKPNPMGAHFNIASKDDPIQTNNPKE